MRRHHIQFPSWLALLPVTLAALVGCQLPGCGSSTPTPDNTTNTDNTPIEGLNSQANNAPVEPLPALNGEPAPPELTTPAPSVTDLASATSAVAIGHHAAAEPFLSGDASPAAKLLLAQVYLATGRYAEVVTLMNAVTSAEHRVAVQTTKAEALLALGRYPEVEQTLGPIVTEAGAFRANVLLGRTLTLQGRSIEARPHFMRLIQAYNSESIATTNGEGLAYVAMAARALGSHRDANEAFQESNQADGARAETQIEWASMFLEKYDAGNAEESLQHVFEQNPESARAHALMARVKLEQSMNFPAALAYSERALAINPNLAMAHVTLAGVALRDMEFGAADAHLDRALAVNPNDLEALSVRAAVRFLQDDEPGFEAAKQEVFRRNRRFSQMYSIIAEFGDWEHRYPEIVAMGREAVTLNPGDALAHATLGMNLLRMGDEEQGLLSLRNAWQRDRFNVRVYNMLNLYDDVISTQYELVEAPPFTFRMHRDEREVLERYLPPMILTAYGDMRTRYGFVPEGPLRMEMYSDREHFAVRTSGLPSLGVQGVCFGKVITAISPAGGAFNWGQVTWHELAHIFHIQLSNNHVPRWFTEGLAEYETIVARPEWRRELDHVLWAAFESDRIPAVRLMNRAFTRARSGEDMMTAYYASSMLVKYMVERFQFSKMVEMLQAWGQGQTTDQVIQGALGISSEQLDQDFRQHLRRTLSARSSDFSIDPSRYRDFEAIETRATRFPRDASAQASLAMGEAVRGNGEEAKAAAEAAVEIDAGQPVARYVLARLSLDANEPAAANTHLQAIFNAGKDGYDLRLLMARISGQQENNAGLEQSLRRASEIDPSRPEAWQGLLEIATRAENAARVFEITERLAQIDQHGRRLWGERLRGLAERNRWDEVVSVGESAIFIDPYGADIHRLLGEGYLRTGVADKALEEFDVTLMLEPEQPGPTHLARARALTALGRARDAREAADEAVRIDPSLASQVAAALRRP